MRTTTAEVDTSFSITSGSAMYPTMPISKLMPIGIRICRFGLSLFWVTATSIAVNFII